MASVGNITVLSQTGVGTSTWVMIDLGRNPINIAILVAVSGTVTFQIEHTYDDPNFVAGQPSVEPKSNSPPVAIIGPGASGSVQLETTITAPYFAFRLNVTAGTGTATMQAIQAGIVGA